MHCVCWVIIVAVVLAGLWYLWKMYRHRVIAKMKECGMMEHGRNGRPMADAELRKDKQRNEFAMADSELRKDLEKWYKQHGIRP